MTRGDRIQEEHSDLVRVCHGSVAESVENPIRVVTMAEHVLAELDALGDGFANSIYLGEQIMSRPGRVTGHPGRSDHHIGSLKFGKLEM